MTQYGDSHLAHTGSCLCGQVRVTARGALRGVVFCHCSQCRKQTGLYYAATEVADDQLSAEGAENVSWYEASAFAKRGFCKMCGSALFWKAVQSDVTSVMAGLFDQPSGLEPAMHIFTADKGDFYEIADDLPQHERSSDDVPVAPV
ncbi:GFA family protein [Tianweitania sp.]|uniref:GFA family protein n=1 Tax=Tianweitania sp. TaxID=2021634 RepID=UPI0028967601|nr:GFA family protein [Tianweitania sp.]